MGISKTAAAQRYLQIVRRIARSSFLFIPMIIFFSQPDQDNRHRFYDIYHLTVITFSVVIPVLHSRERFRFLNFLENSYSGFAASPKPS